jgi:hypothetical protein
MKATRRSFLAALASIPFLGRLFPEPKLYVSWDPRLHANVYAIAGPRSPLRVVHRFNGKVIPFEVWEPSPEMREFYSGVQWPANAIRYDGPEVFFKAPTLAERMRKAKRDLDT